MKKELNWRPDASSSAIRLENVSKKSPRSSKHTLQRERSSVHTSIDFQYALANFSPSLIAGDCLGWNNLPA